MRRLRRAVTAVAAVALLAGCGGTPEAAPPPTASPSSSSPTSPSPSASPSASASAENPPSLPETAQARGQRGARAFVNHYIDILNYVTFGGEVEDARSLDTGNCVSCDRMLKAIEKIQDSGGRVEGGAWIPEQAGDIERADGWVVDVNIRFGRQEVVRRAGGEVERFTGGEQLTSFILEWTKQGWRVAAWTRAY